LKISVFGLGYVGTVCAGCFSDDGHQVVGVDLNSDKVDALNSGVSPIIEPDIGPLIRDASQQGRLRATTSADEAILESDISFVCVGTPSRDNGDLDLSYVDAVCKEIGAALRTKAGKHTVVLRSTMLPGSTERVAVPALERHSGRRVGDDLTVCYNPEFLREGSSVRDFREPPKVVIGVNAEDDAGPLLELFGDLKAPWIVTSLRVAEMVKYADNAFHALKITFANEIGSICKAADLDSHEVMSIFCRDTKLNISPAYLTPGFAFGGSCLPKDLRALNYLAKSRDLEPLVLASILRSNEQQIRSVSRRIIDTGLKRVGFLGMSFKPDTDDLRESPLVEVIETLLGKGLTIAIYDPNVSLSRLVGANRRFIEEHIPHLSTLLVDSFEQLVDRSDVLVVGHRDSRLGSALETAPPDKVIVDLARPDGSFADRQQYDGLYW
jgi:GDP-mannose 6-dehydrogenase